jgi:hypothetical protein
VFFLWPFITYDWSAGTERVYKFKGVTTGYDYTVTQKPANIIAGKSVDFMVSVRQHEMPVRELAMNIRKDRPCVYGWQICDVTTGLYVSGSEGTVASKMLFVRGVVNSRYYFDIALPNKESPYGIADCFIDLSPVYPSWLGWFIK